ncbi:MAG: DUF2723 domain-containing protein [Candidatus Promineifilaceae bacterium]
MRSAERTRPLNQNGRLGITPLAQYPKQVLGNQHLTVNRVRFLWPSVTAGVALIVYLLTVAPDLTWANYGGDGGELITASVTLGIPHPPGYPLYLLVGKLASLVPIGSVAYRYNLLSAVALALAAGFLSATVSNILSAKQGASERFSRAVPVATGLVFAFIPLVWGQAIIAEVYTLNLFLLSLLLWMLTRDIDRKSAIIAGLIFGLSLTTHLTSALILPLSLYLLPRRYWYRFALGATIGILPFLVFPILANTSSPVAWGRSDTLSGWLWFITARIYRPNVLSLPQGDWWTRFTEWGSLFFKQFAWFAIPLITLGYSSTRVKSRRLIYGLIATIVLYAVYSFGYRANDATVFFLPGILLLAITLGFGMKSLGIASLLLPALLVALNFGGQYLGDDFTVRTGAEWVFRTLPSDAIVITPGDQTASTLLYFQQVEGTRSDAVVVDDIMFQFDWYRERLKTRYPSLLNLERDDVPGFIESNLPYRSVCHVALVSPVSVECEQSPGIVLDIDF